MRYYITGHRDLSKEEFSKIYIPEIDRIIHKTVMIIPIERNAAA